jgi:uncharacterized protein
VNCSPDKIVPGQAAFGDMRPGTNRRKMKRTAVFVSLLLLFFFASSVSFDAPLSPNATRPGTTLSGERSTLNGLSLSTVYALDVPPLKGYINDYGEMISPAAKRKIEKELRAFEQSDSTQVFVLTIPSLEGEALEDYSMKVAEAWKVGKKGKDNGILLLVANKDRKIRIEVGRGLEGKLTDLASGQIIDLVMKPRFKRGDFEGGFVAGVAAIVDATRGEFKAEQPRERKKKSGFFSPFLAFLLLGGVALLFLGSFSRTVGAIGGGIGAPALVYFTLFPAGLIPLVISGLVGAGIGYFLPLLFTGGWHGGGGPFWGGFGGGFFGSGGGGGGGGDSGGFDGGGGGDFGGGGASGDWD